MSTPSRFFDQTHAIIAAIIAATVTFVANVSFGQFLRDGTHEPPIFYPGDNMTSYFFDQEWLEDPADLEPIRSLDVPFEWAQGWIRNPNTFTRAMVMGQPESCPLMAGVYSAPDAETAVRLAFTSCFYQNRMLEPHQAEQCGCQLAMVDQVLFVEPGEFTNFAASPAVVSFNNGEPDILGIVYFGEDLIGRQQDIRFVDANGVQRCEGTYNINIFLLNNIDISCDFFCKPYRGTIKIQDFNFSQRGFKPTAEISSATCEGGAASIAVGRMLGE